MPLYEHVFIARRDISPQQAEALLETYGQVLRHGGGKVVRTEYWGLRNLAYRIKKNRKGHYALMDIDAPAAAVAEMSRRMRLDDEVIRFMTLRVDRHEEGPSAPMLQKGGRDDRRRDDHGRRPSGRDDFRRRDDSRRPHAPRRDGAGDEGAPRSGAEEAKG